MDFASEVFSLKEFQNLTHLDKLSPTYTNLMLFE